MPPSTTPRPGGKPTCPSRPDAWFWRSHAAVLSDCQMPLKSGLPSRVRGMAVPAGRPAAGAAVAGAAGRAGAGRGAAGAACPPASVNAVDTRTPAPARRVILPNELMIPGCLETEDVFHGDAAL